VAELVVLRENYRSTQTILDGAHSLIAGKEALRSNTEHEPDKVRVLEFADEEAEVYGVVDRRGIDEGFGIVSD